MAVIYVVNKGMQNCSNCSKEFCDYCDIFYMDFWCPSDKLLLDLKETYGFDTEILIEA